VCLLLASPHSFKGCQVGQAETEKETETNAQTQTDQGMEFGTGVLGPRRSGPVQAKHKPKPKSKNQKHLPSGCLEWCVGDFGACVQFSFSF